MNFYSPHPVYPKTKSIKYIIISKIIKTAPLLQLYPKKIKSPTKSQDHNNTMLKAATFRS